MAVLGGNRPQIRLFLGELLSQIFVIVLPAEKFGLVVVLKSNFVLSEQDPHLAFLVLDGSRGLQLHSLDEASPQTEFLL